MMEYKKLLNGMNAIGTDIKDAYIITTEKKIDKRGFFIESFNLKQFRNIVGYDIEFVQDNHSKSSEGVLRGLHYQVNNPQGKLVRCTQGSVFDVIVDLRSYSPTYKKYFTITLDNPETLLWVPPGLAHGFYTLEDDTEFEYKVTDYYYPEYDRTLLWNDKTISIMWSFYEYWGFPSPILSEKDENGLTFDECEKYDNFL